MCGASLAWATTHAGATASPDSGNDSGDGDDSGDGGGVKDSGGPTGGYTYDSGGREGFGYGL